MRRFCLVLLMCLGTSLVSPSWAESGDAMLTFESPEHEATYNKLTEELRCLVCQNQNLAGSDADLAKDLRAQVYEMVEAGKSRSEVVDYMVARYGDFVLYRPAFKLKTLLLWVGPVVFLLLTLFFVTRWVRRQPKQSGESLSDFQRSAVRDLLNKDN
ncbi:cytochrome c-type biogenesis protein [Leucothrix mucor]|uniref:cytochrome c-type biogenesis protein n=1 Tax=Leucothrix mucor TaxID=45248 RepID=UPI0003B58725|nr:cytochrome c-type biogenesis protein [Leucothrix mucor]